MAVSVGSTSVSPITSKVTFCVTTPGKKVTIVEGSV